MSLLDEIQNGPLAAELGPHVADGNDQAIADILNRADIPALGTISTNDFVIWAAASGQRAVIEDTASNVADPLRSVGLALQDLVRGNLQQGLDFSKPQTLAMAQAWKAAGKMTQEQYDSLMALAATTVSRAQQLGISVDAMSVARALR